MHISLFLSILLLGFTILNLLQGFGSTLLLPDVASCDLKLGWFA
ncbi:hypothetical protein CsSME_00046147 [Camellia sinensis var. sinensis]